MNEKDRLINQFERAIDGQPWHGPSLASILEHVAADQAAHKPSSAAHSMWEILLHMTGWTREVASRTMGNIAREPERGDWPPVGEVTEARWRAAQTDHLDAHRELVRIVRGLSDDQLAQRVPGDSTAFIGAGLSVLATLWGLLQHDVYHAGQLAILKKMAPGGRRPL